MDSASRKRALPEDVDKDLDHLHHSKCCAVAYNDLPSRQLDSQSATDCDSPEQHDGHSNYKRLLSDENDEAIDSPYETAFNISLNAGSHSGKKRMRTFCARQLSEDLSNVNITKDDYRQGENGSMAVSEALARMLESKLGIDRMNLRQLSVEDAPMNTTNDPKQKHSTTKVTTDDDSETESQEGLDVGTNKIFFELSDDLKKLLRLDFKRRNLMQPPAICDSNAFQIAAVNKIMPPLPSISMAIVPYVPPPTLDRLADQIVQTAIQQQLPDNSKAGNDGSQPVRHQQQDVAMD